MILMNAVQNTYRQSKGYTVHGHYGVVEIGHQLDAESIEKAAYGNQGSGLAADHELDPMVEER